MAAANIRSGSRPANTPNSITLAERFIAIGGRLMINPAGRFEPAIDPWVILGSNVSDDDRETRFSVSRAFYRQLKRGGAVKRLKRLVEAEGVHTKHGWMVLDGAAA